MKAVSISELRSLRESSSEYAVFDVRESAEAHQGHIFGATFLPRQMLMSRISTLVPRRSTPIVVYDGGAQDTRARRVVETLTRFGYDNVRQLTGGWRAWLEQGGEHSQGSNVPSKWFGETVQDHCHTPVLSAKTLHDWATGGYPHRICDIRSPEEFERSRIPGAVGAFGTDLAWAAQDFRDEGLPVVVHCSGRTRSIIACQSLRLLGHSNAYALENGTMGWRLNDFPLELEPGAEVFQPSANSRDGGRQQTLRMARDIGAERIDATTLLGWMDERKAGQLNLYLFDVRQVSEYMAGHLPGATALPGGLAIQRTDEFIPIRAAQIVLVDDDEARASLAAYWLRAMGLPRVAVLIGGIAAWQNDGRPLLTGRDRPSPLDETEALAVVSTVSPVDLQEDATRHRLLYVDTQARFLARRPLGAEWVAFGEIEETLERGWLAGDRRTTVLVAQNEALARSAALNAHLSGRCNVLVLAGGFAGWQAQGYRIESGPTAAVQKITDVVVQPYDSGLQSMRDYLIWEQALTRQRFPSLPLFTAYMPPAENSASSPQGKYVISEKILTTRVEKIRTMLNRVRAIVKSEISRETLNQVKQELLGLAVHHELFPIDEFPAIVGANASMYLLAEDSDHRYALYMVAPPAGGFAPPHDHQTWAVIAGMYGREQNKVYRRLDDGTVPSVARVEVCDEFDVVAGTALALMPDDIHSIHLGEDGPHGSLHLYGLSVEHCRDRRMYSLSKGTYKIFPAASGIVTARGAIIGVNKE